MTFTSSLHDCVADLGHWWQLQREKLRDIDALRAMSPREIDELSGELGLSRSHLEVLVKAGPEAAAEMERMMAALHIDPKAVQAAQPALVRDMRVTCATCSDKTICRRALADGTAPALLTSFCPNSEELVELSNRPDFCSV